MLREHAAKHNELADLLVEREVIFTEDVERIFGARPWKSRTDVLMEEEALKLAEERTKKLEAEAKLQADTQQEAAVVTDTAEAESNEDVQPSTQDKHE